LRHGQETGELRADLGIDVMNDMVFGPMLVRAVMRPDADLPEGLAEQMADAVLNGLRPVRPPTP
ncbi:TetR/AcrR family transcriptional regulator C-terminal ligand-binding domain-containing protein, partial [Streptomyces viridochromogenes]|uniref:TetR/AcrR family transcriptional regulator C-terminal ligand-binding domain-containing protein n=2 Tax=Streptomyces TaxID=1883 RepID=UPI0015C50B2D